jgi:hypothetical protein
MLEDADDELGEAAPIELEDFLGLKAYRIVTAIPDEHVKEGVMNAVEACARALNAVDEVDLSEQELADLETPNVAAWSALASDVRNVLLAVRSSSEFLVGLFPAGGTETNDSFAFDFEDETMRAAHVEKIVRGSSQTEEIGEGVRMLVGVLQRDIVSLGEKLRNPAVVGDRWFLLAELHQFLGQCAECLEAIVATVLNAATTEDLGEVLPRYLDTSARNVMLRSAVVDLAHDVDEYNRAIARAEAEDLLILASGLIERLNQFSTTPAYKFLKPQDKRAVILVRIRLNDWSQKKGDATSIRNEVEGFSKFLALMRDLNWRDALAEHDRRIIAKVRGLLRGGARIDEIMPQLQQMYGRDDAIDDRLRAFRLGLKPAPDELRRALEATEAKLAGR